MRSLFRLVLTLVLTMALPAVSSSGCFAPAATAGGQMHAPVARPAQIDTATAQMSRGGLYRISYSAGEEPITINKLHTWTVHVETPDGQPVADADVSIEGGMPEHNHGIPTQPQVTPAGAGDYRVEGMKFQMPGWWTVTVVVLAGDQQDSATFNLLLD
jgi:hypothetical protein